MRNVAKRIKTAGAGIICILSVTTCLAAMKGMGVANERITEGIVRDHFKADPHFQSVKWDEQMG